MKSPILIVPAAVLATATAVAILTAQAGDRSPTLDPGFVPNTGQINIGHAAEPWSDALPQVRPPSQEEARAALSAAPSGCNRDGADGIAPRTQRAAEAHGAGNHRYPAARNRGDAAGSRYAANGPAG
jgi:hypothetical protein